MKYFYLLLSFIVPLHFVQAQSIDVGNIWKKAICFGDTVYVPYSASGSFAGDNSFSIQLSDANGSFSTFVNVGYSSAMQDSVPIVIGYTADHFRFRVIATKPYTVSNNASSEIRVIGYPNPIPLPNFPDIFYGASGFAGEPIHFHDQLTESQGSTFLWNFDQDASALWTTIESPDIIFSTEGVKTGKLTVTNSAGCATSNPFQIRVLTCNPVIPDSAHIVTGNESGSYPFVWVKPGGNYSSYNQGNNTVYVEPGGSLRTEFRSVGLYYVKNGASVIAANGQGFGTFVLGNELTLNPDYDVDTFYCNDLQFDYSKILKNDVQHSENPLRIIQGVNNLQITCSESGISVSIVNLLGAEVFSKTERDALSIDLSSLANGVYFAIITAADRREVRKIAVVH